MDTIIYTTVERISIEYDGFERDLMLSQDKRKFQLGGFSYTAVIILL